LKTIDINVNPEFGIELVLALPHAYWLHKNNKLGKVTTSMGMKPFYYFTDDVEEMHNQRTIINEQSGLSSLPNDWIYGDRRHSKLYSESWEHWENFYNLEHPCGILDYRQWELPNYNEHYKNDDIKFEKPVIVISNRYNWEHGHAPVGYFDIKCLSEMFYYLTESGYTVIYKRPKNTEFPIDQNEVATLMSNFELKDDVEDLGVISDYELTKYYDDVHLLDDVVDKYPQYTYNEVQLKLFANTSGFIGMGGGSTLLLCLFQKPTIAYYGRRMVEANRKYFWEDEFGNKNIKNYHYMINPNLTPFIDADGEDMENDYNNFLKLVKENFNETN
tara:strand:+ start:4144 stop:5136 length:993 start_codon:yes stop_codon:yes gene_type:complete